jgi:hypothetical protein
VVPPKRCSTLLQVTCNGVDSKHDVNDSHSRGSWETHKTNLIAFRNNVVTCR